MSKPSLKLFFILNGTLILFGCAVAGSIATSCARPKEVIPRIVLAEELTLPAVSGLAWLVSEASSGEASSGEVSSGVDCFVSTTEDGFTRVWEVFTGRQLYISKDLSRRSSGSRHGDASNLWFADTEEDPELTNYAQDFAPLRLSEIKFETNLTNGVFSPDGAKKIMTTGDGGVSLLDTASGRELARYYGFADKEWISVAPAGFYNASYQGSSFLAAVAGARRCNLSQLSGALFRPDLFAALLSEASIRGEKPELPLTLESLFTEETMPPQISLSLGSAHSSGEGEQELLIKITEQNGGTGMLALYHRLDGREIPSGLLRVEEAAKKKYSEKSRFGKSSTCYEICLNPSELGFSAPGELGVSVFNKSNTVESERHWLNISPAPPAENSYAGAAAGLFSTPELRVLIAIGYTGDATLEKIAAMGESFQRQEEGELYSGAELRILSGEEFTQAGFVQNLGGLCAGAKKGDVMILYLRGTGQADTLGNLRIVPVKSGEEITGEQILEKVLGLSNFIFLLDLETVMPQASIETALLRFRQRLGPKAMLASVARLVSPLPQPGVQNTEGVFVQSILKGLNPAFSGYGADGHPSGSKFIDAAGFLAKAGAALAEQGNFFLAFPPGENFMIADAFINTGELKFQTMASGMLKIDQVDISPVPLTFGDTMIRKLPAGSYIIDMIYRNGYRETRIVELRGRDSAWVIFNYVPPNLWAGGAVGEFPGGIFSGPLGGINLSELNPVNYQKVNREAMEGMGMAPHYVAFLSGEKSYKDGDYDKAITEYNRAISLKADYADAYASRGNASRRKGELDLAIDDYTRALGLKRGYAEVFNYRGYVYARKGDHNRAIADYTQAIRHKADYADAYFNRAHAHGQQGNWDLSISDYTQVIKLEPSNAVAYNERGTAWHNKGEKSKAAADYETAEKLRR